MKTAEEEFERQFNEGAPPVRLWEFVRPIDWTRYPLDRGDLAWFDSPEAAVLAWRIAGKSEPYKPKFVNAVRSSLQVVFGDMYK